MVGVAGRDHVADTAWGDVWKGGDPGAPQPLISLIMLLINQTIP